MNEGRKTPIVLGFAAIAIVIDTYRWFASREVLVQNSKPFHELSLDEGPSVSIAAPAPPWARPLTLRALGR